MKLENVNKKHVLLCCAYAFMMCACIVFVTGITTPEEKEGVVVIETTDYNNHHMITPYSWTPPTETNSFKQMCEGNNGTR
jgi:hypothetical protein